MAAAKPDYGIDAPRLVRFFLIAGGAAVVVALVAAGVAPRQPWAWVITVVAALAATYLLGMGGFMVFESRIGKVRTRDRLLDRIAWRGDETVLDVGCGRGLMLVGAARRLTTGRGVGIDIWQAEDQSANTPDAALANAAIAGVADRVAVRTADMRDLPFAAASFDVIVSHWAVHNIADEAGRDTALGEMVRVLRRGGTIVLADILNRDAYADRLTELGLAAPELIVDRRRDAVLKALTFGSFRPFALIARKTG